MEKPNDVRVLHFGDADMGMLYNLDDIGPDGATWVTAQGTVEMPASARLLLTNHDDTHHLAPLANLAPDDLWELDLEYSDVQDDDLRNIAHFMGLQRLDLSLTSITEAAVPYLARLQGVRRLGLYECDISRDGVQRLRRALPGCKLAGLPSVHLVRRRDDGRGDHSPVYEGERCISCGNTTWEAVRLEYTYGEKYVFFRCTACSQEVGTPYSSVRWVDGDDGAGAPRTDWATELAGVTHVHIACPYCGAILLRGGALGISGQRADGMTVESDGEFQCDDCERWFHAVVEYSEYEPPEGGWGRRLAD